MKRQLVSMHSCHPGVDTLAWRQWRIFSACLAGPWPQHAAAAGEWRSGGPFDDDGNPVRMNAIAASPQYAQDGTIFAAGSGRRFGSLYRTTDRGYSWIEVLYPEPPDPYSGGWFGQVAVAASASGPATTVFASYNGNLSPDARGRSRAAGALRPSLSLD